MKINLRLRFPPKTSVLRAGNEKPRCCQEVLNLVSVMGAQRIKSGRSHQGKSLGFPDICSLRLQFGLMFVATYELGNVLLSPTMTQPRTSMTFTRAGKPSCEIRTNTRLGGRWVEMTDP